MVLFGAVRNEPLRPAPLEVKEGRVTSVSFGPEARIAAGYAAGDGGGVVLFDASGASGCHPHRWRSRRAPSKAWASARRAS